MSMLCHRFASCGGMPTLLCAASFNDRPGALPHAFKAVMLECWRIDNFVIRSDDGITSKP
jgi:hypothetical protein